MLDYLDVLADLHRSMRPRTYLEVGIWRGDALRLASEDTMCVGVDPEPDLSSSDEHHCHIEMMTSDAFFAGSRSGELFGDRPIDLVFIDGMHLFEYALRDFFHSEAIASPESLIVLHDVLPMDAVTASRMRTTDHWTGDVWKLVLCLLDHRPDLDLSIIDVPPSGLCLVRGLNPADQTLRDEYDAIVEEYLPMGYGAWEARLAGVLQRTTGDPAAELWSARKDLAALRDRLAALQTEFDDRTAWALELDAQCRERDQRLVALQREFDERSAWALRLNDELTAMKSSALWRSARALHLAPRSRAEGRP